MKLWILEKENTEYRIYEIWISFFQHKVLSIAEDDYAKQIHSDRMKKIKNYSTNELRKQNACASIVYNQESSIRWNIYGKEVGSLYFDINAFIKEKVREKASQHKSPFGARPVVSYSEDGRYAKLRW